jgi:hypothetical protein
MRVLNKQEEQMPELPFFDTIPANVLTTSSVTVSAGPNGIGSNTGIIHSAADQDWFRISLRAGELYQFQLNSTSGVDPTLALHDAAGVQVAFDDDSGPGLDSLLTYRSQTGGTYYLDAGGFGSSVGSYSVVAREVPESGPSYASVGINASFQGDIQDTPDQDSINVSLVAGQNYIFDVHGTTLSDPTLALRNSAGVQVAFNDDGGPGLDSRIEFTPAVSGAYSFDVGGFGASTGQYTLSTRIDDVADDVDTTDSVAVGGSRSGTINSAADEDWFGVSLVAGQSYIFDAHGVGLSDPTLALRNSAGAQVSFNDDGGPGLDSRIEFTAGSSGMYFLDVGGFSANTGSYTLSTRVDDVSDDVNSIDTIAVNGVRSGTINSATDQDFFQIFLAAGQAYTFDAVGVGLSDPTLAVRNSAGTQLAFNDDSGGTLNSHVNFTAPSNGTYYLDVGGFGAGTGTYNLFG